jgi:hypothetical protein
MPIAASCDALCIIYSELEQPIEIISFGAKSVSYGKWNHVFMRTIEEGMDEELRHHLGKVLFWDLYEIDEYAPANLCAWKNDDASMDVERYMDQYYRTYVCVQSAVFEYLMIAKFRLNLPRAIVQLTAEALWETRDELVWIEDHEERFREIVYGKDDDSDDLPPLGTEGNMGNIEY